MEVGRPASLELGLQFGGILFRNQKKILMGCKVLCREGGFSLAISMTVIPYVSFSIVLRLHDDFRRHPKGSANKCALCVHALCNLRRNTKICEFDFSMRIYHDVTSLNVPKDNVAIMQISETSERLSAYH
jgi:hypothetical protein